MKVLAIKKNLHGFLTQKYAQKFKKITERNKFITRTIDENYYKKSYLWYSLKRLKFFKWN